MIRPAASVASRMTAMLAAMLTGVLAGAVPGATAAPPAAPHAEPPADAWPQSRGMIDGTGRSAVALTAPLAEAWRRDFATTAFGAVPVIARGRVYVGDLDGTFHALSLEDGAEAWTFVAEDAGFSAAAAVSTDPRIPLVVVGDDVGVVRALDLDTGAVRWTHETGGEISGGPTILPTGHGLRVLVGSQDASLSCLELATGRVVWTHAIADQIRCAPTVSRGSDGDRIFLAGCDGRLHVIDAADGRETASVEIDGPTGTTPAVAGERVFFGTEGGAFYAIDHRAAEVVWRTAGSGGQAYRSSAAIAEGLVIVGSRGRAVEALRLDDGARAWRHPMRGRVDASPIIVRVEGDGGPRPAAVVADAAGTIALLDAASGDALWEFDAGGGFSGGPAAAAGRVVLAGDDGTVWCFRSGP